ncbi:hypothetical protein O162_33015 [Pseudomonas putida SJ3]|nr:hypothetical protein O162_33015 [Pseudomonas putida SJ3]
MFVRLDIEPCAKAIALLCHRTDWPETNVGAGLPREAPRGRRSISQATKNSWRKHPQKKRSNQLSHFPNLA